MEEIINETYTFGALHKGKWMYKVETFNLTSERDAKIKKFKNKFPKGHYWQGERRKDFENN